MIGLSKWAYRTLKSENSDRIELRPLEWWKKSKLATIWVIICLTLEIPLAIAKYIIMAVCFIPYKVYEALEDL